MVRVLPDGRLDRSTRFGMFFYSVLLIALAAAIVIGVLSVAFDPVQHCGTPGDMRICPEGTVNGPDGRPSPAP